MPFPHTCFGAPGFGTRSRGVRRTAVVLVAMLATVGVAASEAPRASALVAPSPGGGSAPGSAALVPVAVALRSHDATVLAVEAQVRRERAGMICPVRGTVSFFDDFGDARSGGRRHEGNDIMSETGVPVVAVVDGAVSFKSGSRQGRGAYVRGEDGNEYWYFHLSAYEGEARLVRQGDVIGYTGATGNAGGTHTHFEVHPGWDPYEVVNPYERLDLVCTDRIPVSGVGHEH